MYTKIQIWKIDYFENVYVNVHPSSGVHSGPRLHTDDTKQPYAVVVAAFANDTVF